MACGANRDIMDSHKRNLARQHDGEVMFVDAPSCEAGRSLLQGTWKHYEEEMDDQVLLNLRGIKRRKARSIEVDMESYFSNKAQPPTPNELPCSQEHQSMFSVDSIHPNDEGYRFWGRYIADSIVKEWTGKRSEAEVGVNLL